MMDPPTKPHETAGLRRRQVCWLFRPWSRKSAVTVAEIARSALSNEKGLEKAQNLLAELKGK